MVERPGKTFKRVQKMREEEFTPPGEPTKSYKRVYKKTKMSWPLALIYFKRGDVLVAVALLYIAAAIGSCLVIYLALQWLLRFFGVVI